MFWATSGRKSLAETFNGIKEIIREKEGDQTTCSLKKKKRRIVEKTLINPEAMKVTIKPKTI